MSQSAEYMAHEAFLFVEKLQPRACATVVTLSGEVDVGKTPFALQFDIHGDERTISINGEEKE